MPAVVNTELGGGLTDTRGVKKLEPEEVAEAIVEAIETNRFDVWVPKSSAEIAVVLNLVPRKGREAIARFMKADKVLAEVDEKERAAYEDRAAHSTADETGRRGGLGLGRLIDGRPPARRSHRRVATMDADPDDSPAAVPRRSAAATGSGAEGPRLDHHRRGRGGAARPGASKPRASRRSGGRSASWFRSGVHPAIQVCVRRNGAVILDRAIGHARGTGPRDPGDAERVLATTETPFCVYSTSKAITAFVVHKLGERGLLSHRRPGRRVHPRVRGQRQGRDHDRPRPRPSRRRAEPAPGGARPRLHRRPRPPPQGALRRQADLRRRPGLGLPRRRRRLHPRRGRLRVTGRDIRTVLAEEFLDPLGFRWRTTASREPDVGEVATQLHHRPAHGAAALQPAHPRARARRSTGSSR